MEPLVRDQPSPEREAVDWLLDLPGEPRTVGSSMPADLERTARILHPAQVERRAATWDEIAAWSGRRLAPDSDSERLMVRGDGARWDEQPGHGRPGEGTAGLGEAHYRRLSELLAAATDTPEQLWLLMAVDEYQLPREPGTYTRDPKGMRASSRRTERRKLRRRKELEERCGVTVGGDRFILHRGAFAATGGRWMRFPSYWWPQDRSWLVYTHIDCASTYVAGDDGLVERLLHDDLLEAVEAQPEHPFDGHG